MLCPRHSSAARCTRTTAALAAGLLLCASVRVIAQTPATDTAHTPAVTPSNTSAPRSASSAAASAAAANAKPVSERQAREAEDAYLDGARNIEHDDMVDAEKNFARAIALNPNKQEYVLSLAVAKEHHLTELVQAAAKARLLGDGGRADSLLQQARLLDPDNAVITQHLGVDASPLPTMPSFLDARGLPGSGKVDSLSGPVELEPTPGLVSLHYRGGAQDVVRQVYQAFGITVVFDPSVTSAKQIKFDLDNVDFATAIRVLTAMTHTFAVAVQPHSALIAKDTQELRDSLGTQIEETVYLPGITAEAMTDLANMARNVFDIKTVTASPTGGDIVIRGDEPTLKLLNATYADMLDGGSDVLIEVKIYEIDKTHDVNIGGSLPSSIGAFSLAAEAQQIVSQNQSLINEILQSGLTFPKGATYYQIILIEALALVKSGLVSSSQFGSLFAVLGTYGGLPLAGVFVGGSSTFNLLLNSSDTRSLDAVQIRAGDGQPANFRAGTRYPIVTATFSSGISGSALAGLGAAATSALSSLGISAAAATAVSVPQIQYEDLGVTVKATPKILRNGNVHLDLDMKIEALAGGTVNSIPILNNRSMTSSVTVPSGQTALLASQITRNEARSIEGVPGLSELPGFQGTEKNTEIDSSQLLITITPHIVRRGAGMRIASRPLLVSSPPPVSQ